MVSPSYSTYHFLENIPFFSLTFIFIKFLIETPKYWRQGSYTLKTWNNINDK